MFTHSERGWAKIWTLFYTMQTFCSFYSARWSDQTALLMTLELHEAGQLESIFYPCDSWVNGIALPFSELWLYSFERRFVGEFLWVSGYCYDVYPVLKNKIFGHRLASDLTRKPLLHLKYMWRTGEHILLGPASGSHLTQAHVCVCKF